MSEQSSHPINEVITNAEVIQLYDQYAEACLTRSIPFSTLTEFVHTVNQGDLGGFSLESSVKHVLEASLYTMLTPMSEHLKQAEDRSNLLHFFSHQDDQASN